MILLVFCINKKDALTCFKVSRDYTILDSTLTATPGKVNKNATLFFYITQGAK